EIAAADGAHTRTLDQRKPSGPWHRLGRYPFRDAATKTPIASIRLSGQGPGVVVADSVRFVGPFAPEDK
ncbi:MAG: hypothetical protein H7Z41_14510, partial [Cytophagales bacterium]|nr:hypothetical protein [Armatimonadota bacterium]